MKPLMVDLFCGLGGWAEGGLAEGYDVIGFDIERHVYGERRYPGQLVVQDVLTLHGSQFRGADLIVASPPCQEYSYMAMPWALAKAKAAAIRADKTGAELERLNRLFNACFRIQREACEAAGRHIPLVVENVRGAQPWVGRARWNYGSFYLWGDVPALMPTTFKVSKVPGFRFDGSGKSFQSASVEHTGVKTRGHQNKRDGFSYTKHLTNPYEHGLKMQGIELGEIGFNVVAARRYAHMVEGAKYTRSDEDKRQHIGIKRKMASAMIAKIPEPLSRYIAATFRNREIAEA
jgi:C-5 cytosine-specific DNA methylase